VSFWLVAFGFWLLAIGSGLRASGFAHPVAGDCAESSRRAKILIFKKSRQRPQRALWRIAVSVSYRLNRRGLLNLRFRNVMQINAAGASNVSPQYFFLCSKWK
jgi:hypothetical protein